MKVILPTTITPAPGVLVSTNVVDEPLPAWSASVAYAVGARVIHQRRIFEAVEANTGKSPPDYPEVWLDTGATNSWAMFDQSVGSQSTRATPIIVKLKPGVVSDLALLNIDAELVQVQLRHQGAVVWSDTRDLRRGEQIDDWFDYFFSEFRAQTDVVFAGIPPYAGGELTVSISKPINDVAVGVLIVGRSTILGDTQISPRLGINDYSLKQADQWGGYTVVERAFSKRMSASVLIDNTAVDEIARVLAKYRATPLLWSANDDRFGSLIVYGFYKSFEIDIAHYTNSFCSLEIEGLT